MSVALGRNALCIGLLLSLTAFSWSQERSPTRNFIRGHEGIVVRPNIPISPLPRSQPGPRTRDYSVPFEASREAVTLVQRSLNALGYYSGAPDGSAGPQTRRAIGQFQASIGDEATGILTDKQALLLLGNGIWMRTSGPTIAPASAPASGEIRASRLFAGPEDYPPSEFAAYGILAFKSRASSYDRERHLTICDAYISSIRAFDEIPTPLNAQMATVWPVTSSDLANRLMRTPSGQICQSAVDEYGSVAADRALRHAALAGADLTGLGPYLLAWSPSAKKGEVDAIVLIADLSNVHDYPSALEVMLNWVRDIERDPSVWSSGWSLEKLRLTVQRWFDRRGSQLLHIVSKS